MLWRPDKLVFSEYVEMEATLNSACRKPKKGRGGESKPPDEENETFLGPILCGLIFLGLDFHTFFATPLFLVLLSQPSTSPVSAWPGVPP